MHLSMPFALIALLLPLGTHAQDLFDARIEELSNVDQYQKYWTSKLDQAGKSCIRGWDTFASDTPKYTSRLSKLAVDTRAAMTQIKKDVSRSVADVLLLNSVDACEKSGSTLRRLAERELEIVKNSLVTMRALDKQAEDLKTQAVARFETQALKQHRLSLSCPLRSKYQKVAKFAVNDAGIHDIGNEPINGFALLHSTTLERVDYLENDQKILTSIIQQLEALQKSCATI